MCGDGYITLFYVGDNVRNVDLSCRALSRISFPRVWKSTKWSLYCLISLSYTSSIKCFSTILDFCELSCSLFKCYRSAISCILSLLISIVDSILPDLDRLNDRTCRSRLRSLSFIFSTKSRWSSILCLKACLVCDNFSRCLASRSSCWYLTVSSNRLAASFLFLS